VPHLARARAEHPLDERIAELTALGLYRSGRQADALAELASLRHDLSEQLGVEPGPAIADLERRILVADPTLIPQPPTAPAARELRKTVTVVAVRLPSADPEEVRAATVAVGDLFDGLVSTFDGWCPTARSGRLLAVFGVPAVHEDDAERAVRAADALDRAARAMGLETRVALATGEVLLEVAGDHIQLLTHDPVEVADRLARKARGGEVLLGEATHRLTQAIAAVDPAPLLVLDEAEAPIVAHRVVSVAETRAARRITAPMVGREHELGRLREGSQRALAERRPTLLTVLGAAGVGKSRLVAEFAAGLGDRIEVAVGRCLPYGRDIGMWPVAQIVRAIAAIPEGGTAGEARRRLNAFVAQEPDGQILGEQLGALVGLADRSPAPDETSWAIRRFLEISARRRPLVVVIEDLQWAEDQLLDLVGYASTTASDVPIALVCTARPELVERRPTWGSAGADAMTIRLEPLGPSDTDDLLVGLLGTSGLEPEVRERIASAAEGNPLFLEETVSILIDDGHLDERDGRWEPAGDLRTVPLPPTVKALLEARVDRLPIPEREVLEAAAVVGREFSDEDLEDLHPDDRAAEMTAALDALCRRDLLVLQRLSSPGNRWYAFRHVLMLDVVYQAIPREVRARDHERFGRGLIDRAGERLAEIQEIVGYHLETAYQLRRGLAVDPIEDAALGRLAASHLTAAGRRALSRDDLVAGASLFGRALACIDPDAPERGELARLRAGTLFDIGKFDEAEDSLRDGFEAADRSGDEALRWRLDLERINLEAYLRPGERSAAAVRAFADGAVDALTELGDVAGLARANRLLGEALLLQGRQEEANEAFLRGWKLAEEAGDERELAVQPQLTGLHGPTPLPVFIRQCEQALADAPRPRPEPVMRLALALALTGREEDARHRIDEGLAHARDVGGAFRVADAEVLAGAALLCLDDPMAASTHLQNAVDQLSAIGEQSVRSTALALLADAWFRLGRTDEADEAAEQSRLSAADDDQASQMGWRQVRAKVLAIRGQIPAALELITEATQIADATDFLALAAAAHLDAADVMQIAGDVQAAGRERRRAVELLHRKGASERIAYRRAPASVKP
jgi:tetratricopeptide (TPR) repeat protein